MIVMWLFLLLIWGVVFGFAGVAIANNKGVSAEAGFWLGALLGPIGLVIVALLSPPEKAQQAVAAPRKFEGNPDLGNDAYRLWLTSRYNIEKNEVLSKYVCNERLFDTVDDALRFAAVEHNAELAAKRAAEQRRIEERERWREKEKERLRQEEETFQRRKPYYVGAGAFALIVFSYFIYVAVQDGMRRNKIARARIAAEKAKQDGMRRTVNEALAPYGVAIGPNGKDAALDKEGALCSYSSAGAWRIAKGKSAHFWTVTYPPDEAADDLRLTDLSSWQNFTTAGYSSMFDAQKLFRNKRTGDEALVTVKDETDYKSSPGSLEFKVKVSLCVGKPIAD